MREARKHYVKTYILNIHIPKDNPEEAQEWFDRYYGDNYVSSTIQNMTGNAPYTLRACDIGPTWTNMDGTEPYDQS